VSEHHEVVIVRSVVGHLRVARLDVGAPPADWTTKRCADGEACTFVVYEREMLVNR
jgi:hypothetical protein